VTSTVVHGFSISRRLFALAMGLVFAIAFLSLAVQVRGLFGARGIQPAADFLKAVAEQVPGTGRYWQVPTLFWHDASDTMLMTMCWAGVACSVLLAAGVTPGLSALLCWGLYLSYCSVGSPFLDFQWDILLLEGGLLAVIALPWRLRPDWTREPPLQRVGRWLIAWLVFRLTFESGLVKLAWGDRAWLDLRALEYHFETQPIPHAISWYAHQLPPWCLGLMCLLMFAVELVVPFLLVFPRRIRHAAAVTLVVFQVSILVTGNFAFFNWLSIALCLPLFDNGFWPEPVRRFFRIGDHAGPPAQPMPAWRWAMPAFIGVFVFVATGPGVVHSFNYAVPDPLGRQLWSLRSFNSYGLFRVMTTERPEIIVEGSRDGVHWDVYEFRWKPGNVNRAPGFVAPHQPRLDWQMWFAALERVDRNPWFVNFLVRLLENSPDVVALLESNPFSGEPPRYVRATVYQYHFTRREDSTSAWWKREPRGLYCPPLTLRKSKE
jgi:lipase maturation factor 1